MKNSVEISAGETSFILAASIVYSRNPKNDVVYLFSVSMCRATSLNCNQASSVRDFLSSKMRYSVKMIKRISLTPGFFLLDYLLLHCVAILPSFCLILIFLCCFYLAGPVVMAPAEILSGKYRTTEFRPPVCIHEYF